LIALLASSVAAQANTIIVNGASCTLQNAITAANADTPIGGCPSGGGPDTIKLTANIILDTVDNETDGPNGLPSLTSQLILNGQGHIITRANDFGTPEFRIIHIAQTGSVEIIKTVINHGVVIDRGADVWHGGALFNRGTLVLTDSTVSDSMCASDGGGIANYGEMTLRGSHVVHNQSIGSGVAGIYNEGGEAMIINSRIADNHGFSTGGIENRAGSVTLINSTLENNDAKDFGGFLNESPQAVRIEKSMIASNFGREGGGITNGIITNEGDMLVENSTISGNGIDFGEGSGISNGAGDLRIINSTLSGNSQDIDIFNSAGLSNAGTLTLENSIVANTMLNQLKGLDCFNTGAIDLVGVNLIEDGSCGISSFPAGTDPNLGPLADNGGPTSTHVPLADSPVIDATTCVVPTDQRGVTRPKHDGFCDIGSVEFGFIDTLLTKFDAKIAKGTLKSTGNTEFVRKVHRRDYRNLLLAARNGKIQKKKPLLCAKLKEAWQRLDTNGKIKPNEWVTGKPAPGYAARIQRIQQARGCR
jgi:hypothetical protein